METDESIDSVLGAIARAPARTPPFVIGQVVGGRYTMHGDEVRLAHDVTHRNVCLEDIDGRWVVKMELVLGQMLAESLLYAGDSGTPLHRLDASTREDVALPAFPIGELNGMAVSPDASMLYFSRSGGRTKRHVMTNFGDRPRRP